MHAGSAFSNILGPGAFVTRGEEDDVQNEEVMESAEACSSAAVHQKRRSWVQVLWGVESVVFFCLRPCYLFDFQSWIMPSVSFYPSSSLPLSASTSSETLFMDQPHVFKFLHYLENADKLYSYD